jgi:hypothetical protein
MKGILEELKMTQLEFKEICVLSGTDYNINADGRNDNVNLSLTLKHFRKFKCCINNNNNNNNKFYDWLIEKTDYISDIDLLIKINGMFDLDLHHENLDAFKNIKIVNGPIFQDDIENIMIEEDFIFYKET